VFKARDFGLRIFSWIDDPDYPLLAFTTFTHLSYHTLFAIHDYHVLISFHFRLDHFSVSLRLNVYLYPTRSLYEHLTNFLQAVLDFTADFSLNQPFAMSSYFRHLIIPIFTMA
jgi:hypothetical protein